MRKILLKIVFVSIFAVPLQIYGQTAVDSFSQLMQDKKTLEDEIAAKQSELAAMPQPTPLKIIEAKWGRALSWKNVTSVLQNELSKQGGFKLSLSNKSVGTKGDGLAPKSWQVKLFGKYFPGLSKTLKITYFDGEKEEYEEVKQGKPLDLESFDLSKLTAAKKSLEDEIAAKRQELNEKLNQFMGTHSKEDLSAILDDIKNGTIKDVDNKTEKMLTDNQQKKEQEEIAKKKCEEREAELRAMEDRQTFTIQNTSNKPIEIVSVASIDNLDGTNSYRKIISLTTGGAIEIKSLRSEPFILSQEISKLSDYVKARVKTETLRPGESRTTKYKVSIYSGGSTMTGPIWLSMNKIYSAQEILYRIGRWTEGNAGSIEIRANK